ncbi:MAG: hypothetical protein BGN88_07830 [Clostridiales bacterium 43-6]|nr:MAG: hypothetical protein BGN88_07830 [Clostridiales bacterium 43-6]
MTKKTEKKHKSIFLRLALLFFSIYIIYKLVGLQSDLITARHTLDGLKNEIAMKNAANEEKENLLKNGSDKDFIERAARDKLDYIYGNEETFEDISGN